MTPASTFSRLVLALALFLCVCVFACLLIVPAPVHALSTTVVISQVYGGGGDPGSIYKNDLIEIFNRGESSVNLDGWSVQYANNIGTLWQVTPLTGTIAPGQYYLIQEAGGTGGTTDLPAPDVSGRIPIASTTGKLALLNTTTLLSGNGCPFSANVIDFVGYGITANCSEGSATPNLSPATAAVRKGSGCTDSDHNNTDFSTGAPVARNTSFPTNPCSSPATTPTYTPTGTQTQTQTATPTDNPTDTGTPTASETPSLTALPTETFTPGDIDTPTVTETDTPISSDTPTETDAPIPSKTPAETDTPISSDTPTETDTPIPSDTPTDTPTQTPTHTRTPTETTTSTPTATPSNTPSETATSTPSNTAEPTNTATATGHAPPHLVISQIFGGGGNTGAPYNRDFVEIFNPGTVIMNLDGWSVQYAAPTGISGNFLVTPLSDLELAPGQYYLIGLDTGVNGEALPAVNASGTTPLNAASGKLALVHSTTHLSVSSSGCPASWDSVVDFVGYGSTANCYESARTGGNLTNVNGTFRRGNGCQDTDDNASDFSIAPPGPRNAASPLIDCQLLATYSTVVPTETTTAAPGPTLTPTPPETPPNPFAPVPPVLISEFRTTGPNGANDEFIELFNPANVSVNLNGWKIHRSNASGTTSSHHTIGNVTLQPGQHFLLTHTGSAAYSGTVAGDETFGVGFTNDGGLALLMPDDTIVDEVGLSSTSAYQQGAPLTSMSGSTESSYERRLGGASGNCQDTFDNAADFLLNNGTSNPQNLSSPFTYCEGVLTATPTGTATATQTPTVTWTSTHTATPTLTPSQTPFPRDLVINEFLPDPASDWNGDNRINSDDEWIELYNPNSFAVDLSRWRLDDVEDVGSSVYTIPDGTFIEAYGYFIFFGSVSGVTLNNSGDTVRLLYPDDAVADSMTYSRSTNDESNGRLPDGSGAFSTSCLPTPNAPNCSILPTATPTATWTSTTTSTVSPTLTVSPTPTATFAANLFVNEVLSHPGTDWNGDTLVNTGDEWIELYNANNFPINLSGYKLDDLEDAGAIPYSIPNDTTISANGFLVFYKSETNLGLNDTGDAARLLYPDSSVANETHFDALQVDQSWSRQGAGTEVFTGSCSPTPNAPNCSVLPINTVTFTATASSSPTPTASQTATPTLRNTPGESASPLDVVINEVAWAGTTASSSDEWIELFNNTGEPVNLAGWTLQSEDGTPAITLTSTIPAHGYYLLERTDDTAISDILADQIYTGALENGGEVLTLRDSGSNIIDTSNSRGGAWYAGTLSPACSMERLDALRTDSSTNWGANNSVTRNGYDADDNEICGTPKNENSVSGPTPTPSATQTPTLALSPTPFPSGVVINEFLPDPASDWNADTLINSDDEWIELFNPNSFAVDLGSWKLDDVEGGGSKPYTIANSTLIEANSYLIFYGPVSGVTLNNNGDTVRLLYPDDTIADSTTYNRSANDESDARLPDGSGAFITSCVPTPNTPNCSIQPSETPTPTLSPTSTPTLANTPGMRALPLDVVINEIAWTGTDASSSDEWLELYNNTVAPLNLAGWTLQAEDGTPHIALTGTIPARGYYLLERTDDITVADIVADQIYTGALENGGEILTLRDPLSNIIDTANISGGVWQAGTLSPVCSMERLDALRADSGTNWGTNNNVTHQGHDADGNEICGTPKNENSSYGPTPSATHTATPTQTHTPAPGGLFVNEFMPDPEQDWNLDGLTDENDEWIEIYNGNDSSVDLSGWELDDVEGGGSAPYILPQGTTIDAQSFLVLYRSQTELALNNANDDVRLLKPDSAVADLISYKSSDPNASWSRNPDGASYFTLACPPTPDASNCSILPTPTITPTPFARKISINEFVPAPYADFNHDGKRDTGDEWIELYNRSNRTVDLSGWQLDDARSGSAPFEIPDGSTIAPDSFLVYFASETTIGLNNDGDTVRLLHPDGTLADKKQYDPIETNASYARQPDGSETWVTFCVPTPEIANCSRQPEPTPTRELNLTTIAEARQLPDGAAVSVLGSVIAHPCEMDAYGHELTLSDGVAGITVYLEFPAQFSCALPRNEQLAVTGVLRDHFGMRTLYPSTNLNVARHYAPPREIAPIQIHTGDLNQDNESMLVMIQGQVSNGKNGDVIWVNDGTGIVEVYADAVSGASFEGITRGSIVRIYGIAYQFNKNKLPTEGYYLRPLAPDDVIVLELAEKSPPLQSKRGGVDLGAVSIDQALSTRTQNYVTIGGIVTVPPGIIAERDFWIEDANGRGAHIFVATSAGQAPKLKLSENVTVRGRVVSSFRARAIRVELSNAINAYGVAAAVQPHALYTGEIDFSNEGALVEVEGFVKRDRGREIYIDDGSGEVLVYIDASTHIRWSRLHAGDPAHIVGILTRFRGEPEILPRYQSDVQFGITLLPVAGEINNSPVRVLRANARAGEDLAFTRKLSAHASARLPHTTLTRRTIPKSTTRTIRQITPASVPADFLALVSFLLVAASTLSATIALKKYRAVRSAPSQSRTE